MGFPASRGKGKATSASDVANSPKSVHATDRRGGETLVVTKPSTQWQKRASKAEEQIEKLDEEVLQQLLGDDYELAER